MIAEETSRGTHEAVAALLEELEDAKTVLDIPCGERVVEGLRHSPSENGPDLLHALQRRQQAAGVGSIHRNIWRS